jgi:hypothetical protein
MSDAHAIVEWHMSSNWILNHYLWRDNEHAWKVENGKTRGSIIKDQENECDVVVDPSLFELIDLGAPVWLIFAIEDKNTSKQKVGGKVLRVGERREQELKRVSDLPVRTVRVGKNRARETLYNENYDGVDC